MIILGIETSCDETALSLIKATGEINNPNFEIIDTALNSQTQIHAQYGGVFPTMAKREHTQNIIPLFQNLFQKNFSNKQNKKIEFSKELQEKIHEIFKKETNLAKNFLDYFSTISKPEIDLISVTSGPGLEPALWVGINFAKALSLIWNIPLIPVNHMEGHILSVLSEANFKKNKISNINFPAIALLISGGHTEIVLVKSFGDYEIIGKTVDDAVGEAFDKVARILDLEYPGGPKISTLAKEAEIFINSQNFLEKKYPEIKLPRPMIKTDNLDFSFSGLKTAALYLVKKLKEQNLYDENLKKIIAKEFQDACIEVLFKKTETAIKKYSAKSLIIGGGVIANTEIRKKFLDLNNQNFKVFIPEMSLTTDNAIMIAFAGYISQFKKNPTINPEIKADGNLHF